MKNNKTNKFVDDTNDFGTFKAGVKRAQKRSENRRERNNVKQQLKKHYM